MPFTIEQFLEVFREYNEAVYPAQWALLLSALVAVGLSFVRTELSARIIVVILAVQWAWMGIAYHLIFFTQINPAAYLFGSLCIVHALIFLYYGAIRSRLQFGPSADAAGMTGTVFMIFALAAYPILSYFFGHVYPYSPTFGAPCPTTIFTFGILLWARGRVPAYVIAIPFIWSLVGFSAAVSLTIREDMGLFIAGIFGSALILLRNRQMPAEGQTIRP